jgi:hypothetical protein
LTSYSAAKLGSVARLVDNQMSFLRGYLDTDTGYARAYDQQYGRWGRYQLMADAAAAALDGDGGFEINNNITTDWISPHVSLFTQKIMALNTYGVDLQAMGAGITTRIPILGELMRLNAAAPGLAELQNWLESNGKIVDGEAKAAAFNEKFFSSRAVSDAQALSNSLGISPMLFRRIWDIDDFNNIIRAPLPKPTEEPDLRRYDPPGSTPPVQDPPPGGRL